MSRIELEDRLKEARVEYIKAFTSTSMWERLRETNLFYWGGECKRLREKLEHC